MSVGTSIPLPAYTLDPAFMARTAEALGFESIWYAEHPLLPVWKIQGRQWNMAPLRAV